MHTEDISKLELIKWEEFDFKTVLSFFGTVQICSIIFEVQLKSSIHKSNFFHWNSARYCNNVNPVLIEKWFHVRALVCWTQKCWNSDLHQIRLVTVLKRLYLKTLPYSCREGINLPASLFLYCSSEWPLLWISFYYTIVP